MTSENIPVPTVVADNKPASYKHNWIGLFSINKSYIRTLVPDIKAGVAKEIIYFLVSHIFIFIILFEYIIE